MSTPRETDWMREIGTVSRLTRHELLRAAAALGIGATALGAAACGGDDGGAATGTGGSGGAGTPKRGGIAQLAFSDAQTSENLDPALSAVNNDACYCGQIYESLTQPDDEWQAHPLLAESWESNAAVTEWTFKLRPGVKWHDGSPFTAQDAVFSIQRLLDEELGSPLYSRLEASLDPDGVTAPDDLTLVLTMKRSDSLIPLTMGARHAHIVKNGTTEFTPATAIGTGPFKLKSWTAGQSWEVERFDGYWEKGLPYLDAVRGVVIGEQSTKVQAVVSGDSDMCDPIDFSAASTVQGSGSAELVEFKAATHLLIAMDQTQEPFTDERVVRAIKMAVDRERLAKVAYQGYATLTSDTPAPSGDPFYPPDLGIRPQDIDGAKALLAEAGHSDGIDIELFTSQSFGGMVDLAVAFAQIVEPAGIRVKINQWSPDTYWDQVWLVKPMFVSYYVRRHPNEILSVTYASNAPWNECNFKNPELDALLTEGLATADPDEQTEIYQRALQIVADDHGTAIPAFINRLWVKKPRLQGAELDLQNAVFLRKAYVA
jgi:peptide/nickel transport system substrate-binding protein